VFGVGVRERHAAIVCALAFAVIVSAGLLALHANRSADDGTRPRTSAFQPRIDPASLALPDVHPFVASGLPAVKGGLDPRRLDLKRLVPPGAAIDRVWYVPAGRTRPQAVVAWHGGLLEGNPERGYVDTRRWSLTLLNPDGDSAPTRWVPHVLIAASPFGNTAVRLADVTGDGHEDLLVSVGVGNHRAEVISVVTTSGSETRRIYGTGYWLDDKAGGASGVYGRLITESSWGARGGLLWFDEPRGGSSVCCPDFRLRYRLRWTGSGWRPVAQHAVRQHS
jgi:hypothetical protein